MKGEELERILTHSTRAMAMIVLAECGSLKAAKERLISSPPCNHIFVNIFSTYIHTYIHYINLSTYPTLTEPVPSRTSIHKIIHTVHAYIHAYIHT